MRRYPLPGTVHVVAAIDPAKRRAGYCIGTPGGTILTVGCVRAVSPIEVARELLRRVPSPAVWVIERPVEYEDARRDHGNLAGLHNVVEYLRAAAPACDRTKLVRPHAWKGNLPKSVLHRRLLPLVDRHTQYADPDHPQYQDDIADAIGIYLWAIGKIDRGGKNAR